MEQKQPIIIRKRLIPPETVDLSADTLVYRDSAVLITKWRTIRPKKEFSCGVSFYFLDRNYKISRFYKSDGSLLCWYCDVLEIAHDSEADAYQMLDLLLDVKIYPDGRVELLDEDELRDALAASLVTPEQFRRANAIAGQLLGDIGSGRFPPDICLNEEYW